MSEISSKGGKFVGKSHEKGGIPLVVEETGQHIEVEGKEGLIPAEVSEDPNVYEITGTNEEVLDKVLDKVGAKGMDEKATEVHAGDMITCVRSTNDEDEHSYKGTLKQIVSKVNESGGCNPIHAGGEQVYEEGGHVGGNKTSALEKILLEAKPFIEQMFEQRVAALNKLNLEQGLPKLSKFDEQEIKYSLVYDLTKAVGNYINPSDEIKKLRTDKSKGVVTIIATVVRDSEEYYFSTEMIVAGGYNIQVRHYRYIVDTKLPKKSINPVADAIKQQMKKINQIDKIQKNIDYYRGLIVSRKQKIDTNSVFSDEEIFEKLEENTKRLMNKKWSEVPDEAKLNFENSEEEFNKRQKNWKDSSIESWKQLNIPKASEIKEFEKKIEKEEKKLQELTAKLNEGNDSNIEFLSSDSFFKEGGKTKKTSSKKQNDLLLYNDLEGDEYKSIVTSEAFKKWFGDWEKEPEKASKIVDYDGYPKIVFHGTTHQFYEFTKERGNVENYFGSFYYFSSSYNDVEQNYLSSGSDITSRISRLAEMYENDGMSTEKAKAKARKEIAGKVHRIVPVFLDVKNPIDLREEGTRFDAIEEYDEENDEYNENTDSISYKLLESLESLGYKYDFDGRQVFSEVQEQLGDFDGMLAIDVDKALRASETLMYVESENGELLNHQIIGEAYEMMGFDGIIQDAHQTFAVDRNMQVNQGTEHYIVFNSNQIKLADGSNTNFDAGNPDIRFDEGGLAGLGTTNIYRHKDDKTISYWAEEQPDGKWFIFSESSRWPKRNEDIDTKTKEDAELIMKEMAHITPEFPKRDVQKARKIFNDQENSFGEGGGVDKDAKSKRFEKGKKLSESEKREVYATMRDSYKELKRPFTFEDTQKGEKKVWLDDSFEYMVKSGITGKMVRWFITLPDGTIAHPTELFPNVTVSEMKSAEKNIQYNERQSDLRYKKVVDALNKSGEIEKVVSRIKTALQHGAEFDEVYDSGDIGKKNPFTRLRFKHGASLSIPQYTISSDESYLSLTDKDLSQLRNTGQGKGFLHHELAEIDWRRFLNEFDSSKETFKNGDEVDSDNSDTYEKWKSLVNMTKSELKKFYNSKEGKEAGLSSSEASELGIDSGRESARWVMKMKDTPVSEWTPEMYRWAKKQIGFISRMRGNKGDLYDENGKKTPKHTSLLIWGHNPEKFDKGGSVDMKYPIAPRDLWYGDADYDKRGGRLVTMSPDEYISSVRPLEIDDVSRENIDDLKNHILSGKELDPLTIYKDGSEDGRHRAYAAKELGIKHVPVLVFNKDEDSLENGLRRMIFNSWLNDFDVEKEKTIELTSDLYMDIVGKKLSKKVLKKLSTDSGHQTIIDITEEIIDKSKKLTQEQIDFVYQIWGDKLSETKNNEAVSTEAFSEGGLIAPNGQVSNLNAVQYKLVRTPEFKAWFGDWENDPKNASKVVDENGEPLLVYHGTDSEFTIFNKKGKGNRVLGYFFTSDKDFSENYGESKLYFLNIQKIKKYNAEKFDSLNTRQRAENGYWDRVKQNLLDEKYNGVLIDRNDVFAGSNIIRKDYVAFEPTQIKLADGSNTTFDAENPDIRFDEGGELNESYYKNGGEMGVMQEGKKKSVLDKKWTFDEGVDTYRSRIEKGFYSGKEFDGDDYSLIQIVNDKKIYHPVSKTVFDFFDESKHIKSKSEEPLETSFDVTQAHVDAFFKVAESQKLDKEDWLEIGGNPRNWSNEDVMEYLGDDGFYYFPEDTVFTDSFISELKKKAGEQFKSKTGINDLFMDGGEFELAETEEDELLAPNGRKSNLNKEQWEIVRTPQFIAWFGDWINEPEFASKAVDRNGEPIVVYHSSQNEFHVFDKARTGERSGVNTLGFYFTDDFENSQSYIPFEKGFTNAYFLNIRNPKKEDYTGFDFTGNAKKGEFLYMPHLNYLVNESFTEGNDGVIAKNVVDSGGQRNIMRRADTYVVFESNQIKLADGSNTKFDMQSEDVRFGEGAQIDAAIPEMVKEEIALFVPVEPVEQKNDGVSNIDSSAGIALDVSTTTNTVDSMNNDSSEDENTCFTVGTTITNKESEIREQWKISSFSSEGLVLSHVNKSILNDAKADRNISFYDLKNLFENNLIEIENISDLRTLKFCITIVRKSMEILDLKNTKKALSDRLIDLEKDIEATSQMKNEILSTIEKSDEKVLFDNGGLIQDKIAEMEDERIMNAQFGKTQF